MFNHASEAHAYLATVAANISSLAKVTDRETLQIVMKSTIHPLIQMQILEGFLDPVRDKRPKTTEEEWLQKVKKTVLPKYNAACLAHKPKNWPTRILVVAVWLKLHHKYFNQATAKEACELFHVHAKQLLRVFTGKKYLSGGNKKGSGPKIQGKKRKSVPSTGAIKKVKMEKDDDEEDDNDNKEDDNGTWQRVKDRPH